MCCVGICTVIPRVFPGRSSLEECDLKRTYKMFQLKITKWYQYSSRSAFPTSAFPMTVGRGKTNLITYMPVGEKKKSNAKKSKERPPKKGRERMIWIHACSLSIIYYLSFAQGPGVWKNRIHSYGNTMTTIPAWIDIFPAPLRRSFGLSLGLSFCHSAMLIVCVGRLPECTTYKFWTSYGLWIDHHLDAYLGMNLGNLQLGFWL